MTDLRDFVLSLAFNRDGGGGGGGLNYRNIWSSKENK
jgi:hypothetical protein